jgi:hypothetical protein
LRPKFPPKEPKQRELSRGLLRAYPKIKSSSSFGKRFPEGLELDNFGAVTAAQNINPNSVSHH